MSLDVVFSRWLGAGPRGVDLVPCTRRSDNGSGLGIEAQRAAVARHITTRYGGEHTCVAEVIEVESGKKNDRPRLAEALALCRLHNAVLIIAKLDRLARNVAFVSRLMEEGVEFVACDFPEANRLTVHILAAVAEHEREMISVRTKAALAAAKARGQRLGNPRNLKHHDEGRAKGCAVVRANAAERARDLLPTIEAAQSAGATSLRQLAVFLNGRGIPTARGGAWSANQVRRVLARLA